MGLRSPPVQSGTPKGGLNPDTVLMTTPPVGFVQMRLRESEVACDNGSLFKACRDLAAWGAGEARMNWIVEFPTVGLK